MALVPKCLIRVSNFTIQRRTMHESSHPRKIIGIIGGGIAGPVLALHILSNSQLSSLYRPIIFEQAKDPSDPDDSNQQSAGAAIAISANGLYPLYQLGLKEAIENESNDMQGLTMWRIYHDAGICRDGDVGKKVEEVEASGHKRLSRAENMSWSSELQTNMRLMERRKLVSLLTQAVIQKGGQVLWNKKLSVLQNLPHGRTSAIFEDGENEEIDLLVGAEGVWSLVRRHILKMKYGEEEGNKKWIPAFQDASNVYGISILEERTVDGNDVREAAADTHGCFLNPGHLSTSPLPGDVIRWDLQIPEHEKPPDFSLDTARENTQSAEQESLWTLKIAPSVYSKETTIEVLKQHAGVYHPVTGTFGSMLAASTRIIHIPLRQQVWSENEIQYQNIVLIGDAARTVMPSSGQGTSFAIEDATVLADCLLQYPLSAPEGEGGGEGERKNGVKTNEQQALTEYAKRRVKRSKQMLKFASLSCEFGLGRQWYWRLLRDVSGGFLGWGSNPAKKDVNSWPFNERVHVGSANESK